MLPCILYMGAADVTFSLLTSEFVFSPSLSLTWIQLVLSVQFVLRVWLLLDRSWLATVCDVSSGTYHMINLSRLSPCFSYCKQQKLGVEAWEQGYQLTTLRVVIPMKSLLVQRQSPISHSYTVDDQRLQIQFRCDPTRATENPISTPDFSQQPMLTRKKSRWWRPCSLDMKD